MEGALRDELLLALLAGRVLVVFGAGHGDLGRVALLVQQLLEGVQLVALVQGREIGRLQHVTMGSTQSTTLQEPRLDLTQVISVFFPLNPFKVRHWTTF